MLKKWLLNIGFTIGASSAYAGPISYLDSSNLVATYAGSTNVYRYVLDPLSFQDALTAATTYQWNGVTGHLVTVTSQMENDFIYNAFVAPRFASGIQVEQATPWIALSDAAVESEWRWLAGPELGLLAGFQNWNLGEPNNLNWGGSAGFENYAVIHWQDRGLGSGKWYDYGNPGFGFLGQTFVVEFQNALNPPTPSAPEPGTLALMVAGLSGLGFSRKHMTCNA